MLSCCCPTYHAKLFLRAEKDTEYALSPVFMLPLPHLVSKRFIKLPFQTLKKLYFEVLQLDQCVNFCHVLNWPSCQPTYWDLETVALHWKSRRIASTEIDQISLCAPRSQFMDHSNAVFGDSSWFIFLSSKQSSSRLSVFFFKLQIILCWILLLRNPLRQVFAWKVFGSDV